MLVFHVHILGKNGAIEKTYDFLRPDGKTTFEGCDVIIPYDPEYRYPFSEQDALVTISNHKVGDH